jgi:hypothetical protein
MLKFGAHLMVAAAVDVLLEMEEILLEMELNTT